jgi:hypothetical protein
MRKDGRRTAEGELEVAGEQFALERHLLRKPVENQVKVNVASDDNFEALHAED